ncbi:NAD(P)-dependent oxidoreductase [Rhodophyticola sp. CCM32]|uniref:NAD-dependent epimerase/dehydratase family protein n=1 Tax=Rhodophyticola sp. CCM32 TaxID=2916397 RepID=UPI00107F8379|nr:NAD(P)-dependent oxidoreductase [Rhodophyticola sp. CCM32]QBY00227.1 NAD(P)-dependent oxidoreductase [Rhodophyticola sp. CCM32]
MKLYNRILITGAAGRLGTELRKGLAHLAEHVRLSDRQEAQDLQPHEEMIVCELGDYDAVLALTSGVDAIVHFGGAPLETDFETILDSNIRGSYHIYEGARKNGVRRVIYASSVHAIGYHEMGAQIDADAPVRPDSLYGVSKNFVESLSRLYWDKFGIESLCLRIFSSFPEPADRRMLWSWMSFADCVHYVERGLEAPRVGHTIGYGLSDNRLKPVDDSKAGHIGYAPRDTAEGFREMVEAKTDLPDAKAPGVQYLGGWFCELGHPDDESSA